MKKFSKTLLSIFFLGSLFSCGTTTSSLTPEIVTGIEIAGPTSVEVGKTIPLICDVLGSELDEVTWSSSDSSIASVNDDGVVTGISEGTVTITAISNLDSSFSTTYEITVTLPKSNEIKIVVEDHDEITQDKNTGIYEVPLGKKFKINYETVPNIARKPDSVNYEVVFPSGSNYTNAFSIEIQPDNSAIVYPYGEISGVAIKATATYNDFATKTLISSAYFNVYDKNIENKQTVLNKFSSFKEKEKEGLLSSKITKTTEIIIDDSSSSTIENIEHSSFTNASYTQKIKNNNITKIYSGTHNDSYYVFEYDDNLKITSLYENCESTLETQNYSTLYCDTLNGSVIHGHSGVLNALFELQGTLTDNVITFGSSLCYAYSEYSLSKNTYIISSTFEDDSTSTSYDVKLTINFTDSNQITNYTFEETVIENILSLNEQPSIKTTKYKEVASDFVYGNKTTDSSFQNKINMDNFYYTSFEIVDLAGTKKEEVINGKTEIIYDYTSDKYGAKMIQTDSVTGLKKYSTTYDKSLVFGIGNFEPSTATTKIDSVVSSSSNPDQIPNVEITSEGIITINAKKDDNGLSMPGSSTFTFTTKNGISRSIMVEFFTIELTDLIVTNIDSSNNLGTIFQNELSDYFYLNTNPDESRYSFGIEIIKGPSNGLELYEHQKNNVDGLPSFSFSILGKVVGTYKFKFYVLQNPTINSENTYEITILKPLTVNELKEKLINSDIKYSYNTGTTEFSLNFKDETSITFTETSYSVSISQNISYHLEDGAIMIDDNQVLNASGSYFCHVREGKAPFTVDLSSGEIKNIKLYLETTSQSEGEQTTIHYTPYTFNKVVDLAKLDSYLVGKTLTSSLFIFGKGNYVVSLSFTKNHATLTLVTETNSTYAVVDFDFTYDSTYYSFIPSNFTSTNSVIKGVSSLDYLSSYSKLRLSLNISGDKEVVDFEL